MKVSLCMCSSAENHPINHPAHHLPCTFILSYFHTFVLSYFSVSTIPKHTFMNVHVSNFWPNYSPQNALFTSKCNIFPLKCTIFLSNEQYCTLFEISQHERIVLHGGCPRKMYLEISFLTGCGWCILGIVNVWLKYAGGDKSFT